MKRKISIFLILSLVLSIIQIPVAYAAVEGSAQVQVPDNDFLDRLYDVYKNQDPNLFYRLNKLEYLLPTYEKIESKLNDSTNAFRSIQILQDDSPQDYIGTKGKGVDSSLEGRPVYEIRHGDKSGTSVLIWSQMHGTESTGTKALMDIFEFLLAEDDSQLSPEDRAMAKALREAVSSLNIHFVPMINPDASNNWRRYTMQPMSSRHPYLFVSGNNSFPVTNTGNTDLNRDAWTMETREAKLLWRAFANFDRTEGEQQPIFGFTLHDQTSTGVGGYDTPASITLLAPGANGAKYFNDARYRATQIIQRMDMDQIQKERPEMVSRYTDDWGSVYFGDSYVMMGTGMILIESGQTKLDPEKATLRRTNFKAILRALWEMAGDYESIDPVDWAPPAEYSQQSHTASVIPKPPSRSGIYDVLLRNVLAPNGTEYNLGINRQMNVILYDATPGSTTLPDSQEHRSLWYYSSTFSGQGGERAFRDNLTANSARLEAGNKPTIPYITFNNGYSLSRYNNLGSALRFWGDVGYPTNLGMTMGPNWPQIPIDPPTPPTSSDPAAQEKYKADYATWYKTYAAGSNLKKGDSVSFGYEEIEAGVNAENLKIVQAKVAGRDPVTGRIEFETDTKLAPMYQSVNDITLREAWALLQAGACAVRVSEVPADKFYNLPLVVLAGSTVQPPTINDAANGGENNFILANRSSNAAKYAVIGGYLIDLSKDPAYPIWGVRDGKQSALPVAGYPGDEGKYVDSYQGHFRNKIVEEEIVTPEYCIVTFNYDGATDTQSVKYGTAVAKPADPSRFGYTFSGWYSGSSLYDFASAVTADLTLTARWEMITVTKATASATVKKLSGNQNELTISIVESLSDGSSRSNDYQLTIRNNAADTYEVGGYKVFVDTKGNDQVRSCYIVED